MKTILFLCLFLSFNLFKSQTINLSEAEIINRYDDILFYNQDEKYHNEAELLFQYSKNKNYKTSIIKGLIFMQRYYRNKGSYRLSLNYGNQAKALAEKFEDYRSLSLTTMYMGNVYIRIGMYRDATKALNEAFNYSKKIDNSLDQNLQQYNIYATLAGLYEGKNLNDSVIYYHKKGLNLINRTPSRHLDKRQNERYFQALIFSNMNMGNGYIYFSNPPEVEKAEKYFLKTTSLAKIYPEEFKTVAIDVYYSVSYFYFIKKDYIKSIKFAEKVLEYEKENKNPVERLLAFEVIKNSYDSLGNISQQNKYLKLYSNLSDSINRARNQTVVLQLDKTNQKVEKEHKNLRKSFLTYGLTSSLLVSLFGLYWYRRSWLLKKNYNLLIAKLEHSVTTGEVPSLIDPGQNSDSVKNTISSEKETELIKKLKAFEDSGKFLRKGISLSYLAHSFSTNPRQLSLVINKNKNKTFNDYINELRIKYITDQLYNNPVYREYKISYLAEECGYASHQVFINAFRKETGMTPSYFIAQLSRQ
ncbi:helix-turn-helix domain-containing protein [Elizabethkingia meningoseptica]|uniref:helix-turn-helix domain-containing protein n=1 Tax=Elizabethkingia meningoseptica TaxID=238 RepID=UPI0038922CD4